MIHSQPEAAAVPQVLGALAYNPLSQGILFQADYFRDPSRVNASSYLKHSQLAEWNNEATVNPTYKANWAKTDKFVWVMGTEGLPPSLQLHSLILFVLPVSLS